MLRFGIKVVVFPVYIILCIADLLVDLCLRLYSFGAGIIYTVLGLFVILAIMMKQWLNVGVFSTMILLMILFTFSVGIVAATIGIWKECLKDFMAA